MEKKSAVIIDTKLDNQKITKDFKNLEKSTQSLINKYNRSVDSIKSQELALNKVKSKLEQINNQSVVPKSIINLEKEIKNTDNELTNLKNQLEEVGNKREFVLNAKEYQDLTKQYDALSNNISNVEEKSNNLKKTLNTLKINPNLTPEAQSLSKQITLMDSKLSQTKTEAKQMANQISDAFDQKATMLDMKKGVSDIGNKVDKFRKKISRLITTVAVFSLIRNGLTQLRNGFVSLLKTDDKFNNSLNKIKQNLMTAFAPIYNSILPALNTLMNYLVKLTGTIAIFISGLFGKSIKQTSKEAEKLAESLKEVDKSGEEASGSLASFDKLEVISETETTSASKNKTDIDYSQDIMYSQKLLDILNKIKDFVIENKELIIGFLFGIASGLLAIKLGVEGIKSLGIGIAVAGIAYTIESILAYINDPSWENFGKIIMGIGITLVGIGVFIGSLPLIIAGAIVLIIGLLVSNWEKIKELFQKAITWIDDNIDEIKEKFGVFGVIIARIIQSALRIGMDLFEDFFGGIKKVVDGIIKIFKGDFKGGITDVFMGLKSILLAPINALIGGLNELINGINKIKIKAPDWIPLVGGKSFSLNIPNIPKLAKGAVIPPRQEFPAILGDQRHGTNIEAPLSTIEEATENAIRKVLNEIDLNNDEKELVLRDFTIIVQMGNKQAQKFVIDQVRQEENDIGEPLFVS